VLVQGRLAVSGVLKWRHREGHHCVLIVFLACQHAVNKFHVSLPRHKVILVVMLSGGRAEDAIGGQDWVEPQLT
jgi:hypothetical protein